MIDPLGLFGKLVLPLVLAGPLIFASTSGYLGRLGDVVSGQLSLHRVVVQIVLAATYFAIVYGLISLIL